MHPLIELLLNPYAGEAELNLISMGFYVTVAACCVLALLERGRP